MRGLRGLREVRRWRDVRVRIDRREVRVRRGVRCRAEEHMQR